MIKKVINSIEICLIILTILLLSLGVMKNNEETPLYSYVANKKGDYQVLLKENNIYQEQVLESGKYYASKSIDKYMLNFEYNFKVEGREGTKEEIKVAEQKEKIEDIDYKYNITAQIEGTVPNSDDEKKEIWTRNYILVEDVTNKTTQDNFTVKENVDIKYDDYNDLVREYENKYGISIEAKLKVKFNIYYEIKFENKDVENVEDYIELDISLTDSVSNVEKNYEEITQKDIFSTNKKNIYYLISTITGVMAILLMIINKNKQTPEREYNRKINNILKNYGELIVTVSNKPNTEDYIVMNIKKLEDLIDLAEQNKTNIIHYEAVKDKNNAFYVYIDRLVYVYLLLNI